jgi:uncharacterized membrane protein YcaP (DUF421 family)
VDQAFSLDGSTLLRTLTLGVLAYAALLVFLRTTGKRTLSKLNAFDLVVTVALGSTLATILLSRNVSLAQGALALALLVGLQFAITWTSVRLRWVRAIVTGEPSLLVHHGEFLEDLMRRERVTPEEILAAVRSAGHANLECVEAVVLETDGSFSVIGSAPGEGRSTLAAIRSRTFN